MASMAEVKVTINMDAATAALVVIRDLAAEGKRGQTSADRLAAIEWAAEQALKQCHAEAK